jgi:hypothetical protein
MACPLSVSQSAPHVVELSIVRLTGSSEGELLQTGVGVEKVGTNQLISMKSIWQCEVFSSIV